MKVSNNTYYKPLLIVIHIISWLLVFGFPLMVGEGGTGFSMEKYLRHSLVPLFSIFVFYINYFYLVPRFLFHGKMRRFLFLNLLLVGASSLLLHYGLGFLIPEMFSRNVALDKPSRYVPHWFFFGRHLMMMSFVAGLSAALRISLRWRKMEEKLIKIEQEKSEAELKNLKNQLNPHFLLNTLNNIYALITFNGDEAQKAVQELSKLLRYVLYDNQSRLVPLARELDFIENYIALMRLRLSERVKLSVKLVSPSRPMQVAPLIFISLIENAFKHGVSPIEESFISIEIEGNEEGYISCRICNSNFPKSPSDKSGSGIGLEQVQRRLELMYPGQYTWQRSVSPDNKKYISLLIIETGEL